MNCPTCGLDIDEHPANRCLDAWVAEEVMGLNVVSRNWRCGQMPDAGYEAAMHAEEPKYGWGFYNEEGPVYWEDVHDVGWGWPPWVGEDHGDLIACVEPVPFYSADIAVAWEVIQHLSDRAIETIVAEGFSGNLSACMMYEGTATPYPPRDTFLHLATIEQAGSDFGSLCIRTQAETVPLAICRAALKAVNDE